MALTAVIFTPVPEDQYISIAEVMAYMNSAKPFSITYITYDFQKGTGGSIKEIQLAIKNYSKAAELSSPLQGTGADALNYRLRNPNHFANSTCNIRILGAGPSKIRTVHVQLIRRFNGAIVK